MTVNRSAIAECAMWFSVGCSVVAFAADVALGRYHAAVGVSLLFVVITAMASVFPKLHAQLDAQIAEAIAQRDTADLMLKELQRLAARGELRVGVISEGPATTRMH